jgi:hypothetical protein
LLECARGADHKHHKFGSLTSRCGASIRTLGRATSKLAAPGQSPGTRSPGAPRKSVSEPVRKWPLIGACESVRKPPVARGGNTRRTGRTPFRPMLFLHRLADAQHNRKGAGPAASSLFFRFPELDRISGQPAISPPLRRLSQLPSPHHASRPPAPEILRPKEPMQARKQSSEERIEQTESVTRVDSIRCDDPGLPSYSHHRAPHGPLGVRLGYQHLVLPCRTPAP